MATLTVKRLTASDADPELVAAAGGGDQFKNQDNLKVVILNEDASSHDVTFASQVTARPGIQPQDLVVSVPAGGLAVVPIDGNEYFSDSNGMVQMTYDAVTSLSVAAVID